MFRLLIMALPKFRQHFARSQPFAALLRFSRNFILPVPTHSRSSKSLGGCRGILVYALVALGIELPGPVAALPTTEPHYKLQYYPIREVQCTSSSNRHVTGGAATGWYWYQLLPPPTPRQKVTLTVTPAAQNGWTQGASRQPLLWLRQQFKQPQDDVAMEVSVHYKGTIYATDLVPLRPGEAAPKVTPLTPAQIRHFTQPTKAIDYNSSEVQRWLTQAKLRKGADESDLDFGRRVFVAMARTFEWNSAHGSNNTASLVVHDKAGVCGGLSIAYAAALRANGVPAKVTNLQMVDQNYDGTENMGHANNEFYAAGIGWVPSDLTPGQAEKGGDDAILQYFGHDSGDALIEFDGDDEFEVDTGSFGRALTKPGAKSPAATLAYGFWGEEAACGSNSAKYQESEHWKVRQLAPPAAAEPLDANGRPQGDKTDSGPGFTVWRDGTGWHVHSVTDGQEHNWQVHVQPDSTPNAGALSRMASKSGKPQITDTTAKPLFAVGIKNSKGIQADFECPSNVRVLYFLLFIDHKAKPEQVWIGQTAAHPHRGLFYLGSGGARQIKGMEKGR